MYVHKTEASLYCRKMFLKFAQDGQLFLGGGGGGGLGWGWDVAYLFML